MELAIGESYYCSRSLGLGRCPERALSIWQVVDFLSKEAMSWQQHVRGYVTLAPLRYLPTGSGCREETTGRAAGLIGAYISAVVMTLAYYQNHLAAEWPSLYNGINSGMGRTEGDGPGVARGQEVPLTS